MPLSETTVSTLADALKKEVINRIYEDDRYAEVMHDLIGDALHSTLGDCHEDLFFELGMVIMDRIELK